MVSRALSGSHARTICSTRVRPPARCNTLARLDLRRVPFPSARTMTARSWLDMVDSHSAGAGVFWQSGENAAKRLVGRGSHVGKDARGGWFFGRNVIAGGEGAQ